MALDSVGCSGDAKGRQVYPSVDAQIARSFTASGSGYWDMKSNDHGDVLVHRATVAKEICRAHNISRLPMADLVQVLQRPSSYKGMDGRYITWLINDDRARFLYCVVPKTGSTNLRRILAELKQRPQNVTRAFNWTRMAAKESWFYRFDFLSSRSADQISEILNRPNYTKILTVRHPIERIISLYRMLFEGDHFENKTVNFLQSVTDGMVQMIRGRLKMPNLTSENVTFTHLVRYIIDHDQCIKQARCRTNWYEAQWSPVWRMCRVCSVDYDIVIRLETYDMDLPYLLHRANFSSTLHYPDYYKRTSKDLTDRYLRQLTKEQIDGLYEVYKMDYKLFGYSHTRPDVFKDKWQE
ncbi:carbohydrate sulfotransferase 11-like [Lingula anatina]|uniref:Carbohydrate sulfotransferase n=1 Tax=Lingula anatina TaxID=7574 RepID=A0A1S3H0K3_LINAN|nr:carbohydrate sulfotransferase 11-like [Lingula anatina]|eukprot:XP_013379655.1 carbohydrate sulfotransferase 11-like [Lingula anatina]